MVLCDDLEGWDRGKRVGGRLKMEGIHTHTQTHTQTHTHTHTES